jgi:hypothetical protein
MTGGCLCGAVRYDTKQPPFFTSYCHCEDCRRAAGAPVVLWSFFRGHEPEWNKGNPRTFLWSGRERFFCGDCGTPLMFRDPQIPGVYEMTTCSLEMVASITPNDHNWTCDQLPWFEVHDTLPRHLTYTPNET